MGHLKNLSEFSPRRGFEFDSEFDKMLPAEYQALSQVHWTPISVIRRLVEWSTFNSESRVLDVGSGIGKFCVAGAILSDANFVGVEQRADLVRVAQSLACENDVSRVRFVHGNAFDLDWSEFNIIYLYNPFGEHIDPSSRIDESVTFDPILFDLYVALTEEKLVKLAAETKVITYNGFGGEIPECFQCRSRGSLWDANLDTWIKS